MDRHQLKNQALVERVSQLAAQYENQAADYRVEITLLTSEIEQLRAQLEEANRDVDPEEKDSAD